MPQRASAAWPDKIIREISANRLPRRQFVDMTRRSATGEIMHMFRKIALFTIAAFAFLSSANAGMVEVNFSGGSGTPLTITLPQSVSYTVVGLPNAAQVFFVFQGTGNLFTGAVSASGSLSFTQNAGASNSINDAQQFSNVPVVTLNDLVLDDTSFPGLHRNDVFLLSAGSVTTTTNIAAAAPPSGLYLTVLTDGHAVQMGVGTAVPEPGDYNRNGVVDAADYVVWRANQGTNNVLANDPIGGTIGAAQFSQWRAHFGQTAGSGAGALANAAVPEPATLLLIMFAASGWCLRRGRAA
jgi:hypothetical protein